MANIDNELLSICAASEGSKVRASIAKALQRINDDRRYAVNNRKKITSEDNHKTLTGGPWDIIDVDVNEGEVNVKGGATSLDDFGVVTQNGYYDLWNTNWPAGHGWQSFTVDIPGKDYFAGERQITQNGEYFAEYDGYDGYSKVYVNIPDAGQEGQQFKVVFHDQWKNPLEEKIVNFGEDAVFTGDIPRSDTPFMRWDPEPVKVAYNMDCYPVFYDAGYRGTINDDWRTIQRNIRNGTAADKYHIGDTRMMPCTGFNTEIEMVLIKMGDDITSYDHKYGYRRDTNKALSRAVSLWISKNALYGSHIDPDQVLNQYDDILRKEWYYDAQSKYGYSLEGLVDDVSGCYITWNAITYYYFMRGISWHDISQDGHHPRQHVVGEDRINYERISNGGLYELDELGETLRNLDIWTNRYYESQSSSSRTVSIRLSTYDIVGNAPPTQNVHNTETNLYGMIATGGSKYNQFVHTGTMYTPETTELRETKLTALISDYSGNQYNRDTPYTVPIGYVKRSIDGVTSTDTGYSREFLIL